MQSISKEFLFYFPLQALQAIFQHDTGSTPRANPRSHHTMSVSSRVVPRFSCRTHQTYKVIPVLL